MYLGQSVDQRVSNPRNSWQAYESVLLIIMTQRRRSVNFYCIAIRIRVHRTTLIRGLSVFFLILLDVRNHMKHILGHPYCCWYKKM